MHRFDARASAVFCMRRILNVELSVTDKEEFISSRIGDEPTTR